MLDIFNRLHRLLFCPPAAGPLADKKKLYDLAILKELDDDRYLLHMLNIFLQNIPVQLENIRLADAEKDYEKAYFLSHKLKGSAGMLQAPELLDLLIRMEQRSKERMGADELIQKARVVYTEMEGPLQRDKAKLESILQKTG